MDLNEPCSYDPRPRRPKRSFLGSLRSRELGLSRKISPVIASRQLYRSIHPNATIHEVNCQYTNLKRFTPCGQYLIGMSKNQRSVHIYRFRGSGSPTECRSDPSVAFKEYFDLVHETVVLKYSELLSKDFCLVTANGKFIIVAAVSPCTGSSADGRNYPCSLTCIPTLDTVVFYVIEISSGKITDRREFKNEYITIAHHTGVSLYGSLFSVMLVQSQAIQIIHIKDNGKMVDLKRIGWFNHDDDELVLVRYRDFNEQYIAHQTISSSAPYYHNGYSLKEDDDGDAMVMDRFESFALAPTMSSRMDYSMEATYHQVPTTSNNMGAIPRIKQSYIAKIPSCHTHDDEPHSQTISGIKQRLLTFLFRRAYKEDDGGAALRHFHLTFQQFASLIMWRMQLLDESTLLIKFVKQDSVVRKQADSTYQTSFFVIYNIHTTEIQAVYDNASEEFLQLYESLADQFCATAYSTAGTERRHYSSTCSNNVHAKDQFKKTQSGMKHARTGGLAHAIKRSLNVIPFSPQTLSDSPYFDLSLFCYDDKVVSASDRHRLCQDFPIKFYLRGSGELKFKMELFKPGSGSSGLHSGMTGSSTSTKSKRFVSFIAHPFEPFVISVIQQHLQPTLLNFHVRLPRGA